MDYKTIVNLMKEMSHTELTKLEIEDEGFRICIEKGNNMYAPGQSMPAAPVFSGTLQNTVTMGAEGANMSGACTGAAQAEGKANQDAAVEDQNHKKLVSPMVGTFYAQPSPDKPPFVKVGDKVKKGQTICIIEAMKLMNEIESEHDGEVVKILTKNEDMVEFGQPLFLIK